MGSDLQFFDFETKSFIILLRCYYGGESHPLDCLMAGLPTAARKFSVIFFKDRINEEDKRKVGHGKHIQSANMFI